MTKKKLLIGLGIVVILGAIGYANFGYHRNTGTTVTAEKIAPHDLEAVVSASGKIQPKRSVDVSAETVGKVVNLAVAEGDAVKVGQPLLEIDPRNLETAVQNRQASLATAQSQLDTAKAQVENSKVALQQAQDTLRRQEGVFKAGLLPRDQYEKVEADAKMAQVTLLMSQQAVSAQEQRIKQEEASLESAKYDLSKVRIVSPINGIITRRSIEEGETAMIGTMNNAGTVLLTVADMSVVQAEIEVDETDIPNIQVGQIASVSIDAIADKTFPGKVTEVGNSPIQATGTTTTTGRATNFKVVVTLDEAPNVRPGFTCTAVITTAKRQQAIAVPIQAMTVRELIVDDKGAIVKQPPATSTSASAKALAPADLKAGQSRKEFEGVFLIKDGKAAFVPVKTGIAGDKYFEVLSGLSSGDQVITGPFASVRNLKEGDPVTVGGQTPNAATKS